MRSIFDQVDDFLISKYNCIWLGDGILKIYVRKNNRYINGILLKTFDIANIGSISKKHKNKGYFKAFMLKIESLGLPIYVENIHNPTLVTMLEKNGYTILKLCDTHAFKLPQ